MAILDALPAGQIDCDVCVVGTGPVGLALAHHCESLGLRVLALEAGGAYPRKRYLPAGRPPEILTEMHAPLSTTTRRAFGGTSWAWSGGCAFFDRTDFQVRDYIPYSGWPLSEAEIARYCLEAADFLGCSLTETGSRRGLAQGLEISSLLLSRNPAIGPVYWERFDRSSRVKVCLNSPVIALELASTGDRIEAVVVGTPTGPRRLRVPRVALAAGGLRTTQLLLLLQRTWPSHFGRREGPLGRYYMGHLTGWISSIRFRDADTHRLLQPPRAQDFVQRRLRIAETQQAAEKLLNIAFWPSHSALRDPSHLSGPLSLAFLTLSLPLLGRLAMPEVQRAAALGSGPLQIAAHLRNVLAQPIKTIAGVARALRNMVTAGSPRGALAGVPENGSYLLQYHAEQAPNPSSRVTLSEGRDELGLPALNLDLRFAASDARSVVKAHEVLAQDLRAAGIADLEFIPPPEKREESVLLQAEDGYHQIGTTRMGEDTSNSVVNRDGRVHEVANLFVASSSVFPTSSHANPTLLATGLAIRLAHHLAGIVGAKAPN